MRLEIIFNMFKVNLNNWYTVKPNQNRKKLITKYNLVYQKVKTHASFGESNNTNSTITQPFQKLEISTRNK